MISLQRAFRTDAVSLGDLVGIFSGDGDPSSEDVDGVPLGSLYLCTNGQIYRKAAQPSCWEPLVSSSVALEVCRLHASDGGQVPFLMMPDPDVLDRLISVNSERYAFFETRLDRNDLMQSSPGDTDVTTFIMPFDGLIFGFMLYADRVNQSPRNICLMVSGSEAGCITLSKQNTPQTQGAFGLNIPFNRGETIQVQDQSEAGAGNARSIRGIVHVRWRAV
jgi:hypothetical protein